MTTEDRRVAGQRAHRDDMDALWRKIRNAMTFRTFVSVVGFLVTVGWAGYKAVDRLTTVETKISVVESKADATAKTAAEHTNEIGSIKTEMHDFHEEFRDWAGLPHKGAK